MLEYTSNKTGGFDRNVFFLSATNKTQMAPQRTKNPAIVQSKVNSQAAAFSSNIVTEGTDNLAKQNAYLENIFRNAHLGKWTSHMAHSHVFYYAWIFLSSLFLFSNFCNGCRCAFRRIHILHLYMISTHFLYTFFLFIIHFL